MPPLYCGLPPSARLLVPSKSASLVTRLLDSESLATIPLPDVPPDNVVKYNSLPYRTGVPYGCLPKLVATSALVTKLNRLVMAPLVKLNCTMARELDDTPAVVK